jgi:hypothetical protein
VATKRDLVGLEERIDLRFKVVDERFNVVDERLMGLEHRLTGMFEHELRQQTMTMMFGMVGVVMTMAALAFALVRFT